MKVLLKAYQGEIDSLTRRSKTSETSFLNVYKLLSDAPDPYPLLDAAVDQTVKVAEARMLEAELSRLREENSELKKQVANGSSADDKRKKAEARVEQLEAKMDDLIQERVTQKENELNAEYDERIRNYEEREKDLQRQVETHKRQLRDLAMSNENTTAKLMDASQRQEQDVAAKLAELDLVVADLNRANERVATVERRNELLRAEIETARSGSQQADRVKEQEDHIAELEAEASRLLRALDMVKDQKAEVERAEKKRADDAAREIANQAAEIENLRTKAKQYSDYDEIKRELEIMKYVEFSNADLDNDEDVHMPDPNADVANKQLGKSLENLLVSKNRRLLEDLTKLRVAHEELVSLYAKAENSSSQTEAELARLRSLNQKLENDLMQMNNGEGKDRSGPGLAGLDIGGKDGTSTPSGANDASILPIVTSQRDRFRQRNAELEEELRKQFEAISDLRVEIKGLQADNLKLYEKVRYMQSYRDNTPGTSTPSGTAGMLNGALRSREDEIGRYKDKYDESLNPFEAFKGRESLRAIQALNPLERGVFALTRAIIGNKRARSLFIMYAASLHALVVIVLWNTMRASDTAQPVRVQPM
ncbi:putative Golgi vesicle transport-related protein [Cutaneotrichosporon oleaginosum]|uniref:Protein CASP n=1 Tax=Cutaneotrichosporon oleaginosum TaxID=879819 RepID=A0A0J0XXI7_9TREE|nr:putative Golgi vesicle transport-related protein [Cutaneotrichosporon oleaginosum]KLT45785.1 putative Golgi vesicle transport-related protein [Cutaneotrichosporon oleaginosum]TXT04452.1 hypothetical protein COLE_07271 [Cutaneotrichosporon oleaginosum]